MNLMRTQREEVDVNLTPLIDVVFLLLIFFMVTTTFTHETQIKIDLPVADNEQQEMIQEKVDIVIDVQGKIFVNERQVINSELKTVMRAIEKAVGPDRKLPFVINADKNSAYQSFVTVMNAATKLGFTNITMATKQDAGK